MIFARTLQMCKGVLTRASAIFFFTIHLLGGQLGLVPAIFGNYLNPILTKEQMMSQPTFQPFRRACGVSGSEKRTFVTTTDSLRP